LRDRLHDGLTALGIGQFVPERGERSAGITVCRTPAGVDGRVLLAAVAEAGVVVQAGTYPTESSRTFRIGHLGNVSESDVDHTLSALTDGLRWCGARLS
jgi:alanine-glyoxylate transaminase/serine-glyoxylate transaminase/serine-pyruvate transaminase